MIIMLLHLFTYSNRVSLKVAYIPKYHPFWLLYMKERAIQITKKKKVQSMMKSATFRRQQTGILNPGASHAHVVTASYLHHQKLKERHPSNNKKDANSVYAQSALLVIGNVCTWSWWSMMKF